MEGSRGRVSQSGYFKHKGEDLFNAFNIEPCLDGSSAHACDSFPKRNSPLQRKLPSPRNQNPLVRMQGSDVLKSRFD